MNEFVSFDFIGVDSIDSKQFHNVLDCFRKCICPGFAVRSAVLSLHVCRVFGMSEKIRIGSGEMQEYGDKSNLENAKVDKTWFASHIESEFSRTSFAGPDVQTDRECPS